VPHNFLTQSVNFDPSGDLPGQYNAWELLEYKKENNQGKTAITLRFTIVCPFGLRKEIPKSFL
jgi:hypothetical protein